MKIGSCLNCKKKYEYNEKIHRGKYCSHICQQIYQRKQKIKLWQQGKISASGTYGRVKDFLRTYLFEKFSNKCSRCGWSEINISSGKCPLQVHHIDGKANNNEENNLELLCPNCHSLTENFGGLNRGNSTRNDRKGKY